MLKPFWSVYNVLIYKFRKKDCLTNVGYDSRLLNY